MTTTKRTTSTSKRTVGRLVGLALEIPAAAYVALTGEVPLWARIWLCVWLSLWLLATVVQAVRMQTQGESDGR